MEKLFFFFERQARFSESYWWGLHSNAVKRTSCYAFSRDVLFLVAVSVCGTYKWSLGLFKSWSGNFQAFSTVFFVYLAIAFCYHDQPEPTVATETEMISSKHNLHRKYWKKKKKSNPTKKYLSITFTAIIKTDLIIPSDPGNFPVNSKQKHKNKHYKSPSIKSTLMLCYGWLPNLSTLQIRQVDDVKLL